MTAEKIIDISTQLAKGLNQLQWQTPTHVYNPLSYAWPNYTTYIRRFGAQKGRVLLVGMNPGPWGMAQSGVPFGDVDKVRNWLGIQGPLEGELPEQHPKYPILGLDCHRTEGSGQRLWGWAQERFDTAEQFFEQAFIWNYCPLLFIAQDRNLIPEKLNANERQAITRLCDHALRQVIDVLAPRTLVGIGRYAEQRLRQVTQGSRPIEYLLHPSPASPQANRNWASHADRLATDFFDIPSVASDT